MFVNLNNIKNQHLYCEIISLRELTRNPIILGIIIRLVSYQIKSSLKIVLLKLIYSFKD